MLDFERMAIALSKRALSPIRLVLKVTLFLLLMSKYHRGVSLYVFGEY